MSPVGLGSISRYDLRGENLINVFLALFALHSHTPYVYHGDCRLPNLISTTDGKLVWIDFSQGTTTEIRDAALVEDDVKILVRSILGEPHDSDLTSYPNVITRISGVLLTTRDNYITIAKVVETYLI
jgi:hypothetical protein